MCFLGYGQSVSDYSFSQSNGAYTSITGTLVAETTGTTGPLSMDDVIYNLPDGTIPFNFNFNNVVYTGLNISTNGFITFGTTAPLAGTYTPLSATTTYAGAISAFGRDLQGNYATVGDRTTGSNQITNISDIGPAQVGNFITGIGIPANTTITAISGNTLTMSANATSTGVAGVIALWGNWSNIQYAVEGSAPNRVFVIQYANFKRFGTGATTVQDMKLNFQFRLYEGSNNIEVVYGDCSPGLTNFTTVNQVGLRGANNTFPTNINARMNVKGTNDNWLNSDPATANSSGMLFNNVAPANVIPVGLTYRWSPPSCLSPSNLSFTNLSFDSVTLNWLAPSNLPTGGYDWELRTAGAAGSGATGLVNSGNLANNVLSANLTGLSPLTEYTFFIRSDCGVEGLSNWSNISFSTLCLPPTITDTTPDSRCGEGEVELTATPSAGVINWYNTPTGGSSLFTGNTFNTTVTETTTFYAEAGDTSNFPGQAKIAPSLITGTTGNDWGLRFNVTSPMSINSVDVYLTGAAAGNMVVQLKNSAGTILAQQTIAVPAGNATTPVQHTLNLSGFEVQPGTEYRLVTGTGSVAAVREASGNVYPYPLGGAGEIIGGFIAGASQTYYWFYNWTVETICPSPRTAVVATVVSPPALTLSGSSDTICNGQSTSTALTITSNVADYDSYVWSPTEGVTGDSSTGWIFNPSVSTIYTLNASQTTGDLCATSTTFTLNVNPTPTEIVVQDPIINICSDSDPIALVANGGTLENMVIFQENFNGATNSWTTVNNSTTTGTGNINDISWTLRPNGYVRGVTYNSNDNSQFYLSDSDDGGSGSTTDVSLTSPIFSTVGVTEANLTFWHFYQHIGTGTAKVQYSTNGTNWVDIHTYNANQGASGNFVNATHALPAAALNQENLQIRFQYNTAWGWRWALDNVLITGTQSQITWSPIANLFLDNAATQAYNGEIASTVYFSSQTAGSQSYTASAMSALGCSAPSQTVDVTVTQAANAGVISGDSSICGAGNTTTLTTNGDAGGVWLSSNENFATVDANGLVTAVGAGVATISYTVSGTAPCSDNVSTFDVTINITDAPTGDAEQAFCGSANITQLVVNGTEVKWYDAATGGNFLPTIAAIGLTNGTTYYASQTINGCESADRLAVTVTINPIPAAPVVTTTAATCSADGVATIANFDANATYTFTPEGPTVSAGVISSLIVGDSYTVTVTINGCESIASQAFSINGMLAAPAAPVVFTSAASCSSSGTATITNYDSSLTYAFLPVGPTVDETGVISNLFCGTSYTVTASNNNCNSVASTSFAIGCQFATPAVPVIVTTPATCFENGAAFIANFNELLTYSFEPTGPTVGVNGEILNLDCGVSYTVIATNNDNCSSISTTFIIQCVLETPDMPTGEAVQNIEVPNAGDATLANIVVSGTGLIWYASEADALAGINPLPIGTVLVDGATYYVVSSNGSCTSAPFGVTVNVTLGTLGFDSRSFTYYPNPTVDVLNVNYTRNIESVSIVNMLGQEVKNLKPNANTFVVDMSNLQVGTYFMTVTSEEASHTVKVIKK